MAGLASHCAQHSRVACVCFGFFGVSHIAHISSPQTALSSEPRSNRMWPEQHVLCPLPPNAHCAAVIDINCFFFTQPISSHYNSYSILICYSLFCTLTQVCERRSRYRHFSWRFHELFQMPIFKLLNSLHWLLTLHFSCFLFRLIWSFSRYPFLTPVRPVCMECWSSCTAVCWRPVLVSSPWN